MAPHGVLNGTTKKNNKKRKHKQSSGVDVMERAARAGERQHLSKAEQREAEAREKHRRRAELLQMVAESNLSAAQTELLRSSSSIGNKRETTRERLKRSLAFQRAGIPETAGAIAAAGDSNQRRDRARAPLLVESLGTEPETEPETVRAAHDERVGGDEGASYSRGERTAADANSESQRSQLQQPPAAAATAAAATGPIKHTVRKRARKTPAELLAARRAETAEEKRAFFISPVNNDDEDEEDEEEQEEEQEDKHDSDSDMAPAQHIAGDEEDREPERDRRQTPHDPLPDWTTAAAPAAPSTPSTAPASARAQDGNHGEESEHEHAHRARDASQGSSRADGGQRRRQFVVDVARPASVQEVRSSLPVCAMEQEIMEAVREHDHVILVGATGSGKTTQVPQFLYEAGYGHPDTERRPGGAVAVAQPRRVAAISCARRVAEELDVSLGREVGYHVRHEAHYARGVTRVKFATDGMLLRELEADILLRDYGAVVVDEVHERSVNIDLLLGIVSRTVRLRRDEDELRRKYGALKLIVMSATVEAEQMAANRALFAQPPAVISVDARQHPVTVHFARRTRADYLDEAFGKVCKIHKRLPPGSVLVFVTGRREVEQLCERLRAASRGADAAMRTMRVLPLYATLSAREQQRVFDMPPVPKDAAGAGADAAATPASAAERVCIVATNVAETSITIPHVRYVVDSGRVKQLHYDESAAVASYRIGWTSQSSAEQRAGRAGRTAPGHCYRLYSSAVFAGEFAAQSAPEIQRAPLDAVVLRLNALGVARPRAFPWLSRPRDEALVEAERTLVALGAVQAQRVDPAAAATTTTAVTAIGREMARLPVAPRVARMLLWVRDTDKSCMPYAVRVAAVLSAAHGGDLFMPPSSSLSLPTMPRQGSRPYSGGGAAAAFAHPHSELLARLRAVCAAEYAARASPSNRGDDHDGGARGSDALERFCVKHGLNARAVREALHIARQLERAMAIDDALVAEQLDEDDDADDFSHGEEAAGAAPIMSLAPPSRKQESTLRKAVLVGFPDRIARRVERRRARELGLTKRHVGGGGGGGGIAYECSTLPPLSAPATADGADPSSSAAEHDDASLTSSPSSSPPPPRVGYLRASSSIDPSSDAAEYLCYVELFHDETAATAAARHKAYMVAATCIDCRWIASLAPSLCTFGPPLESPTPRYDAGSDAVTCYARATYTLGADHPGSLGGGDGGDGGTWQLPAACIPYPVGRPGGGGSSSYDYDDARLRIFARALLEGRVVRALPPPHVREQLSPAPAMITHAAAASQNRAVITLLAALRHGGGDQSESGSVASLAALRHVWRKQPSFLLREFLVWVPAAEQMRVRNEWPHITSTSTA